MDYYIDGEDKSMSGKRREKPMIEHWQIIAILLVIYDIVAIHMSYFLALFLRFDGRFSMIPEEYLVPYFHFITLYAVGCVIIFWVMHLYQSIWRFASYVELTRLLMASFLTSVLHAVLITLIFYRMPLTYYFGGMMLQFIFLASIRFAYRFVNMERKRTRHAEAGMKKVMLIGAGAAGQQILRDINNGKDSLEDRVVCFIDDNSNKWGRYIDGIPVVGGREDILMNVQKYEVDKIYFAIPSADPVDRREILSICNESGCEIRQLPGLSDIIENKVNVSSLKNVAIEDLLGRDAIHVDLDELTGYIAGKTVLVTGGGGSIGSELCRQAAAHGAGKLIVFDIYENNAYDIQLELKEKYPELDLVVLIGSVRDSRRLNQIFEDYRPDVVYHAAAHKHVPLMEDSPCEALKNNVFGTYKTAYAAMTHGCRRFVLISTDKAVNPTNIMGASKRLCEMVVQSFDYMIRQGRATEIPPLYTHGRDLYESLQETDPALNECKTEFVSVRFGNVLGSNGSVVPIFRKQIEKGGPVTVTHPDVIRYFMTVQEAVSLVLQAGVYAQGGEIFVLDMGEPVKIDTLARNLIKLSGLVPDVDIAIEYTGLRPGEKLYEEKLMAEEGLTKTRNDLIYIGKPIPFDTEALLRELPILMEAAYSNVPDIRERVVDLVTTYTPVNRQ